MKNLFSSENKKEWIFTCVILLLTICLAFIQAPQGLEKGESYTLPAKVVNTDDSHLEKFGLVLSGSQLLQVKILSGAHKGKIYKANNELRGNMELDKQYKKGDILTVAITEKNLSENSVLTAKDYHRFPYLLILFLFFSLLLILFGAWTGVKALLSFVFSCFVIFKLIIPLALRGYDVNMISFGSVLLLTGVILLLVAGFTKKALAAFCGASSGILAGFIMAHTFTHLLHINGASMPFMQTLLYSGYEKLNMQDLFTGGLILAGSGAVMDLAMDIAASIDEIAYRNPHLGRKELFLSGLRIGRSVVGTMTTTLLLAYSGGYLTLLMMFTVQGTLFTDIMNNPLVAAEMVKTLIGSFSLVLVAPFTALASSMIFGKKQEKKG